MMKHTITLLLTLLNLYYLQAATITVSNVVGDKVQFTTLQEAIDAASPRDTLLISGGGSSYGDVTLHQRLTFIGEGHKSENTIPPAVLTQIGSISFVKLGGSTEEPSGSTFYSVYFKQFSLGTGFTDRVDNILMINSRCKDLHAQYGSNWQIINSDIDTYLYYDNQSNAKVYNSVINYVVQEYRTTHTGQDLLIFNSIITNYYTTNYQSNLYAENTIIEADYSSASNGSFISCIFSNPSVTEASLFSAGSISADCKFDTDPSFVDRTDLQLEDFSQAKDAGSDGTDIGITGGTYPLLKINGANVLPRVTFMNLNKAIITPGESLEFEFSSEEN
jgi:hypothetical protein